MRDLMIRLKGRVVFILRCSVDMAKSDKSESLVLCLVVLNYRALIEYKKKLVSSVSSRQVNIVFEL